MALKIEDPAVSYGKCVRYCNSPKSGSKVRLAGQDRNKKPGPTLLKPMDTNRIE